MSEVVNEEDTIRDVWQHNVEEEFKVIRNIVANYPVIAMDTEFPGVVCIPQDQSQEKRFLHNYQFIKCNVDVLTIIQLGLTFSDVNGNRAKPVSTWQFNFRWDLTTERHSLPSIELLTKSGIQFDRLQNEGIDLKLFGELLTASGLVLVDDVTWVTFHSAYDFAYLLKILTCAPLPSEASEFYQLLRIYFKNLYDIKHLTNNIYRGGLQELADQLEVKRIGQQHQAGSDSRLTGEIFFRLKQLHFSDENMSQGILFGIEPNPS